MKIAGQSSAIKDVRLSNLLGEMVPRAIQGATFRLGSDSRAFLFSLIMKSSTKNPVHTFILCLKYSVCKELRGQTWSNRIVTNVNKILVVNSSFHL